MNTKSVSKLNLEIFWNYKITTKLNSIIIILFNITNCSYIYHLF